MEGTSFEEDWAAVAAGTLTLRRLLGRLHQAGRPAGAVVRRAGRAEDADGGGSGRGAGPGAVSGGCPGLGCGVLGRVGAAVGTLLRAGGAAALVRVAEGVARPCHGVLREAVLAARVPVRNAAVALGEMDKLLHRLTPACAETVLGGFVAIAKSDGPREIRALRPRVIARYGRLGEFQRREDRLKHGRSLSQPYADDGMAGVPAPAGPRGLGGAGGDPRAAGRAAARVPSTGRTPGPATSAARTRWSRSAAAPPPPAGPPRPPPRPRSS